MLSSFVRGACALAAAGAVALVSSPAHAADPDVKCEAGKLEAASKYASCRFKVESKAVTKGLPPDFSKCDAKLGGKWPKVEAKAAGACPTAGDLAEVQGALTHAVGRFALWLSATDPLGASRTPASGQTTAHMADKNDGIGGPVAVPDDGTVQAGAMLAYLDNGDGTITVLNTGLMWEKKSNDGGLHDFNIGFAWSGATGAEQTIWDWLDDVNSESGTGFAGYNDWRIPNPKELQTIVDYERVSPSVDPAFDDVCTSGCTVTTCSCTASGGHWSASATAFDPTLAWLVSFSNGSVSALAKTNVFFLVRAVRGGL